MSYTDKSAGAVEHRTVITHRIDVTIHNIGEIEPDEPIEIWANGRKLTTLHPYRARQMGIVSDPR